MARVELPVVVLSPVTPFGPVSGAQVSVINQETGFAATVYSSSSGTSERSQPLLTDVAGRVDGWVERGSYAMEITIPGRPTYTDYFEASPAKNASIDTDWLAPNAVTTSKINSAAVTAAKLANNAVTSDAIESLAVTNAKLAAAAVTTAKIDDGSVTSSKLDSATVAVVPLGTILDWFPPATGSPPWTSVLPPGYAVCNGTPWASIPNDLGYTSGNIPNLVGRVAYGADPSFSAGTQATHVASTGVQTNPGAGGVVGSGTIYQLHSHTVPAHAHGMDHLHIVPSHSHYMGHSHGVYGHSHSIASKLLIRNTNEPKGTVSIATETGSSGSSTDGGSRSSTDGSGNIATTGARLTYDNAQSRANTDNSAAVTTTDNPAQYWDNRPSGVGVLKIMRVRNL